MIVQVSVEVVRPADTVPYTISDIIGPNTPPLYSLLFFPNMARRAAGSGTITMARIIKSTVAVANTRLKVYLFSRHPTLFTDNAPLTALYSDRTKFAALISFTVGGMSALGGTGDAASFQLSSTTSRFSIPYVCGPGETGLYGYLEAQQAYVPSPNEVWRIDLMTEQF